MKSDIMQSKELVMIRLEIAKSYYIEHLASTHPNEFENLACKSFELADVYVKVYKETAKGTVISS